MKKAELNKKVKKMECRLFDVQLEAELLLEEVCEKQDRIRDNDVDKLANIVDTIEAARATTLDF